MNEKTLQKIKDASGFSDEQINLAINQKQNEYCNLITNLDALLLVAKDFGIEAKKHQKPLQVLSTAKRGNKISFVARLHQVNCPKKFTNCKNSGVVLSLIVSDETRQATVILWNKDATSFLEVKALKNDLLLMQNLLVKNESPLELHSTLSTKIETPTEIKPEYESKIPKLAINLTMLKDIASTSNFEIDTMGVVTFITAPREFEKNTPSGQTRRSKVMRLTLTNQGKAMNLVIWNDLCDFTSKIKKGDELYVENCIARQNSYAGQLELHTTRNTHVVVKNQNSAQQEELQFFKIKNLKENSNGALQCTIEKLLEVRTIHLCNKCKKTVKNNCTCAEKPKDVLITSTILKDDTGEVNCTFFEKNAMQLLNLNYYTYDVLNAVFEFKKEELKNRKISLKFTAKKNEFIGKTTLICKELIKIETS